MELKKLFEMAPYVDDLEKMEQRKLSAISMSQLHRAWKLLKRFDDGFEIYQIRRGFGFIGGRTINKQFNIFVDLCVDDIFRNAPTFLTNAIQISMVIVSEGNEERGYAKRMYHEVAKKFTLISDTEQYQASMNLWKSLAREPDIYVYVWNNSNGSFIEEDGIPKRYTGNNIDSNEIFGNTDSHYKIVLIASNKELKGVSICCNM